MEDPEKAARGPEEEEAGMEAETLRQLCQAGGRGVNPPGHVVTRVFSSLASGLAPRD